MDFKGQQLANKRGNTGIVISAVLAFFVGYFMQDLMMTLYVYAVGVFVTLVVVAPNWPAYNKDPIKWTKGKNGRKEPGAGTFAKLRRLFE